MSLPTNEDADPLGMNREIHEKLISLAVAFQSGVDDTAVETALRNWDMLCYDMVVVIAFLNLKDLETGQVEDVHKSPLVEGSIEEEPTGAGEGPPRRSLDAQWFLNTSGK
jgi:hypothetical protein